MRPNVLKEAMHQLRTITTTQLLFSSPPAILRQPPPSQFYSHHHHHQRSMATMSSNDSNLDAIFEQKRLLRSKVRKQLKAMNTTQRSQQDAAIQNSVLESSWFKSSERLCAYVSCSALREVDTSKILSDILCDQEKEGGGLIRKKLYVPRVEDKNSYMRMLNISTTEDLIANSMNILEPSPVDCDGNQRQDVMDSNTPVDLILLPGLAFDRSGRRLGRSGGYYDMFLKRYQELSMERKWKLPLLVALAYDLQILDDGAIPVAPHDIPVDALVSPTGVIPITPAAKERM
ncbi:5-formyltetrahydrofolate cyclo-ligase protein [Thalictrum thalictroides]|uniref:5-formyltetrahydrofolate cyclo-ligase n=1 Tax=Thalictrum thalictroides TaxID=46969 RepID=A0A7J6WJW6_THATH|nr:5-formyltetrahydrofolate cyclo-ligase protein [Thalictrum thalictroides]